MRRMKFNLLKLLLISGFSLTSLLTQSNYAIAVPHSPPTLFHLINMHHKNYLPLSFEVNKGQSDSLVKFLSRMSGYSLFLTSNEAVVQKNITSAKSALIRMKFVGANHKPQITGLLQLPGTVNYFIGNDPRRWHTSIPTYSKVKYKDIYPGIDLIYYGKEGQLEYDFVVAPGISPKTITLGFEGVHKLELDAKGDLLLQTTNDQMKLEKPLIYQEMDDVKQEIDGNYVLKGKDQIGFQIIEYDVTRPLVIDPVLNYSTYLGGKERDEGQAITVDKSGNAYVVGRTASNNFPTTTGTFMAVKNSGFDIFVTKLNANGTALHYSTYIGGSSNEGGDLGNEGGIAQDASGNIYITGLTSSLDFPVTMGAFQTAYGGGSTDAFVAKLNPEGNSLVYSTYLGGSGMENDFGGGIDVNADGNAHVTGSTNSADFPIKNALNPTNSGGLDVFVTKFNAEGSALNYSTYLGGSEDDRGFRIAVDKFGNSFVTGWILSSDFPTSTGAFQTMHNGGFDAFATKLNSAGDTLVYSTYLGGSASDFGEGVVVDVLGNAYVVLHTESADFPTTNNSFQPSFGGTADAAVSKLNIAGSELVYSTYLGGSGFDESLGIALDTEGNAYLTGFTSSTDFPTKNALQSINKGSDDIFVTKLNKTGNSLVYSTYLGGNGDDRGFGITVDASGDAYITGHTTSADFPEKNPIQSINEGSHDVFIAKIASASSTPLPTPSPATTPSGEDTSTTQLQEALNDLNIALNELKQESKVARPIANKISALLKRIKIAVSGSPSKCKSSITTAITRLNSGISQLGNKRCEGSISRTISLQRSSKCIPASVLDSVFSGIKESFERIQSAIEVDGNSNGVPDVCEN
jgi:hypothetical protein